MSLISCPECGKEISNTAKICPNCGLKLKQVKIPKKLIITLIASFLIVVLGTSIIFLSQKPNYEKALEEFVDVCFNGKNTLEDIENLVPEDFWGEHKFKSTFSLEQITDRVTDDREEIEEKYGNIKFEYKLTKKSKLSRTAIGEVEERFSWIYEDVDIDIQEAYHLDFEIYCKKENLTGNFQACSICIDDKWYICQTAPIFNDSEGITDFAIVGYNSDYVDYILDDLYDEEVDFIIEEIED